MDTFEKIENLETILFSVAYSVVCILIFVVMTKASLNDKKKASFKEKFKLIFSSAYFGIFMVSLPWVASLNVVAAVLILLHLMFIILVSNITKKAGSLLFILIFYSILGMYMCVCDLLAIGFSDICWYLVGAGICILPIIGIIEDRKSRNKTKTKKSAGKNK